MGATDTRLQLIFAAKNLASGEMNRLHAGMLKLRGGALGLGGGLRSAAGGATHLGKQAGLLAAGGIAALVGAIGLSVKAAADEQVGIVRLNRALKDNVRGYKGDRTAIEAKIAAQEKLGFSDDALRDSLGALVVKTKDIAKAQKLQALAMDLARARGIDLGTATDTLIKIQNGQYRALKGLGIAITPVTKAQDALKASTANATDAQKKHAKALDDAATKALAIAAIEKATAGQAQAYGDTTAGAFESIKITVGDVVEDLGNLFMPMVKTVAVFVRDTVVPALSQVVTTVGTWIKANGPLIHQVGGFASTTLAGLFSAIETVIPRVVDFVGTLVSIGRKIFDFVVPKIQAFIGTLTAKGGVMDSVLKVVGPILDKLLPALGNIASTIFDKLLPAIGDLVGMLWGDGKGPLAVAVQLIGGFFTDILLPAVNFVLNVISNLIGTIKDVLTWLGVLQKQDIPQITYTGPRSGGSAPDERGNGNARGGPTWPGIPFAYAENGTPESWMMSDGRGRVLNDGGAAATRTSGSGSSQPVINIFLGGRKVHGALDRVEYYDLANQAPTAGRA